MAEMAEIVKCEDCIYMYHCERTYLGECDTGVAWGTAYAVAEVADEAVSEGGEVAGDEEA